MDGEAISEPPPRKRLKACREACCGATTSSSSSSRDDEDVTAAAAAAAAAGSERKDQHSSSSSSTTTTNGYLNEDALFVVMDYLGPKELFRLSLASKAIRDRVTTRQIVRSAMMVGGHAKKTVTELYPLMRDQSIHVPSPQRLLRLVTGRKCELCFDHKVNHVRPGFGTFVCWQCHTEQCSKRWKTAWVRWTKNPKYRDIMNHPRVAATRHGLNNPIYFVWSRHMKAAGSGGSSSSSSGGGDNSSTEWIGPLLTFDDIEIMAKQQQQQQLSKTETTAVDEYLKSFTVFAAPPADAYRDFVNAYEDTVSRSEDAEKERYEKKQAASKACRENRKGKVLQMIDNLKERIDGSWRDLVLQHTVTEYNRKRPCVVFSCCFVDDCLREFVLAPSKMTKKRLQETADGINSTFRAVERFLRFSFLSETESTFEAALKRHCLQCYPDMASLMRVLTAMSRDAQISHRLFRTVLIRKPNEPFWRAIRNEHFFKAVVALKGENFGFLLKDQCSFACDVWDYEMERLKENAVPSSNAAAAAAAVTSSAAAAAAAKNNDNDNNNNNDDNNNNNNNNNNNSNSNNNNNNDDDDDKDRYRTAYTATVQSLEKINVSHDEYMAWIQTELDKSVPHSFGEYELQYCSTAKRVGGCRGVELLLNKEWDKLRREQLRQLRKGFAASM